MSLSIGSSSSADALSGISGIARSQEALARTIERLSSARRINRAADDPAGLAISQRLLAEISGIDQAASNLEQTVNVVQTADGALDATQELVRRQRDLALQAGNDAVLDPAQREALDAEYQALGQAIDRIAKDTSYGATRLLDGSYQGRTIQAGSSAGQTIPIDIASRATGEAKGFDRAGLGLAGTSLKTAEGAAKALEAVDVAIGEVSRQRGDLGALQANTIESARRSHEISYLNLVSAESTIADTDIAAEAGNFLNERIRAQAGVSLAASAGQLDYRLVSQLLA